MPQFAADRQHSLGSWIRLRRRAAGLSQSALAGLAGVHRVLISELENDKPTLRMDAVNRVLAVFGRRLGPVEAPRGEET